MSHLYIIAKLAYRYFYSLWNVWSLKKQGFINSLSDLMLARERTNTMFILGSGASINDIDARGWENISSHTSVGLNFWPIHDFVPSMLMFEIPRQDREHYFVNLLDFKKEKYRNTPMIMKGLYKNRSDFNGIDKVRHRIPSELLDCVFIGPEVNLPGRNPNELFKSIGVLSLMQFFNPQKPLRTLAQYRGTVTCAIGLSIKLGYSKIVLCGVDLNDTKYFYDEDRKRYESQGVPVPPTGQTGQIHKTNLVSNSALPVSEAIFALNDYFRLNMGGEILVANRKSALYPKLNFFNVNVPVQDTV